MSVRFFTFILEGSIRHHLLSTCQAPIERWQNDERLRLATSPRCTPHVKGVLDLIEPVAAVLVKGDLSKFNKNSCFENDASFSALPIVEQSSVLSRSLRISHLVPLLQSILSRLATRCPATCNLDYKPLSAPLANPTYRDHSDLKNCCASTPTFISACTYMLPCAWL